MPNVTIYVSERLREALRGSEVPISETCQRALWDQLSAEAHRRPGSPITGQMAITDQETNI